MKKPSASRVVLLSQDSEMRSKPSHHGNTTRQTLACSTSGVGGGEGEGVIPHTRSTGMCRWVESHFRLKSVLGFQFYAHMQIKYILLTSALRWGIKCNSGLRWGSKLEHFWLETRWNFLYPSGTPPKRFQLPLPQATSGLTVSERREEQFEVHAYWDLYGHDFIRRPQTEWSCGDDSSPIMLITIFPLAWPLSSLAQASSVLEKGKSSRIMGLT